jgi:hypothetical protein
MNKNQKTLLAVLFGSITLLAGCASGDHRIEGRWKSNQQLTVATIQLRKPITPARRAKLNALFGKLVLIYDRAHITAEMPPTNGHPVWHNRMRYRVVASDSNSVALVSSDPLTGEREISHIHFDGPNRYWLYLHGSGWKEYFDRINPQ